MTTVLRPPSHFEPLDGLPMIGALAVALTLHTRYDIKTLVRWPNDVTFRGRKLAGTLVEAKFSGNAPIYALLGLGLNANFHTKLIAGDVESAITVLDILGSDIDRAGLISSILLETEHLYDQVRSGRSSQTLELLKQNELSRGNRVTIQLESGRLAGIFDDYETLTKVRVLEDEGGVRKIETSSVISVEYLGCFWQRHIEPFIYLG